MFELTDQKCVLANYNPRIETHGEEKKPACDLKFVMNVPNDFLAHFAPSLRSFLFHQQGIGNDLANATHPAPNLRFEKMREFGWDDEVIGASCTIAHGLGGESDLTFGTCNVNSFKLDPKEGGTVVVSFRVQCYPDEKQAGKLYQLQGLDCNVTIEPPEAEPDGKLALDKPLNTAGDAKAPAKAH